MLFTHPTSKFEEMAKQTSEVFTLKSPLAMPDGYVSLVEAMRILDKSHQQIDRYVKANEIESRMIHRPNRKPERIFLEASLILRRDKVQQRKEVRPPSQLGPKATPASLQIANVALEKIAAAGVGMASAFESYINKPRAVLISEKLWLSIDEAELYSGLARADLLRLAKSGDIVARKSSGWKLQRRSLEEFNG